MRGIVRVVIARAVGPDALAGVSWTCGSTPPGLVQEPAGLDAADIEWLEASVPGTVAGALRDAGRWTWGTEDEDLLDGRDWWFRCRFEHPGGDGPWELQLGGLATLADVWLGGAHVLGSENMFTAHRVAVDALGAENELAIRFRALGPVLAARHPRPRWKSRLIRSQNLRWYRTSLLGRMPGWSGWAAPVGPWQPVRLLTGDALGPAQVDLRVLCDRDGPGGSVSAGVVLRPRANGRAPHEVRLHAAGESVALALAGTGDALVATGALELEQVERWWPHTHGAQPLYDVELEVDGARRPLRRVGFRTVEADRAGGGFQLRINGLPIFCRGVVWTSPDAVSFAAPADEVRSALSAARDAGMNMLRVAGYGCYEGEAFWDACDELGILVWQDCMLASYDPPEDEDFVANLEPELRHVYGQLQGRPALAVACGSTETYLQSAVYGLPPERYESRLLEQTIPATLESVIPDVPYVVSSPSGGEPPFAVDVGVSHYFGVGAYLRAPIDARVAGVRFATECLSFGTPPERETVDEAFGSASVAGHAPRWKQTVAYDAGASWDYEEVRDHYVREVFGLDPLALRYADPERALDLGRAVVAELMSVAVAGWRRSASACDGALVLMWRDLWPGAGWGVIDSLGRPKAPFYALRRVFAPTTVVITDEGLSGLLVHVFHDGSESFPGSVRLRVFGENGEELERAQRRIELAGHTTLELPAASMLDGFRDLSYAYRFAARVYDIVVAELCDNQDVVIAQACHLVGGPARPQLPELGLAAHASRGDDGQWSLTVSSELFAHYVSIDAPGWRPADSWFHVPPGAIVELALTGADADQRPRGSVRALNCARPAQITVQEA